MSAAYYPQVQKIYVAYYGRPADPAGLQYWAGQLAANGGSLTAIINAFGNSAESTALYAGADNAAKVTAIYQQLFNRSPDSAGLAFYVNELSLGRMTAASIALNVANGATGTDATYLTNKQAVASSFTDSLTTDSAAAVAYSGTAAANTARALISGVTTSAATTNVASTIAAIKPGGGAAATGQTFTLTVGADVLTGTARNDTFTAPKNTFNGNFDLIVDSSTTDSDTLNLTYDAADLTTNLTAGAPLITNVENVNVNFDTIGTGTFNANFTSNAVITVSSSRPTFAGSATVNNVGTSGGNNVVAGKGVTGTLTVAGMKAGYVDAGSAATVALTNAANTDTSLGYDLRVNGNVTVNPDFTGATTDRSLAITASKDATVTLGTITNTDVTQVLGGGSGKITLKGDALELAAGVVISGIDTVQLATAGTTSLANVASTVKLTSAAAQTYTNVSGHSITSTAAVAVTAGAKTASVSKGTVNFTKDASTLTAGTKFAELTVNLTSSVENLTGPTGIADTTTINVGAASTAISQTLGAGDVVKLVGSGDVAYTVTTDATTNTIDASGLTGGLTVAALGANAVSVTGGAGNDSLSSASTANKVTISTGTGTDTVTMSAAVAGATITIDTGADADTVDFADVGSLAAAKITVKTGTGDDTIKWGSTTAGATAATTTIVIDGGDGNDTLVLKSGDDFAHATALTTGAITISNVEVLDLSAGAATVSFASALLNGATYTIKGSSGTDEVQVKTLSTTTSTDLSKLVPDSAVNKFTIDGSPSLSAQTIIGTSRPDSITGGDSADSIDGGASADTLVGGKGNDTILGGTGNDTITLADTQANNGTDTITLGAGADIVNGDAITAAGVTALTAGTTYFTVTDFTAGTGGDQLSIDISALGGAVAGTGYLAAYAANSATLTNAYLSKATISSVVADGAADTSALTTGSNIILFDTAANIILANLNAKTTGKGMLAIASDTGDVYMDLDANFTSGAVIVGRITLTGTMVSDNIDINA